MQRESLQSGGRVAGTGGLLVDDREIAAVDYNLWATSGPSGPRGAEGRLTILSGEWRLVEHRNVLSLRLEDGDVVRIVPTSFPGLGSNDFHVNVNLNQRG
jgi:hypothetical protein